MNFWWQYRKILLLSGCILGFLLLLWVPYWTVALWYGDNIFSDVKSLPKADVAIILGASVFKEGTLSEITEERTVAGKFLLEEGVVDELVVSNTKEAAEAMKAYLVKHGVDPEKVSVDPFAVTTPDTCRFEGENNDDRRRIFLTQGYHLSRTLYQCERLGVDGMGFAVESLDLIEKTPLPAIETFSIRSERVLREAVLTWAVVLGLYE